MMNLAKKLFQFKLNEAEVTHFGKKHPDLQVVTLARKIHRLSQDNFNLLNSHLGFSKSCGYDLENSKSPATQEALAYVKNYISREEIFLQLSEKKPTLLLEFLAKKYQSSMLQALDVHHSYTVKKPNPKARNYAFAALNKLLEAFMNDASDFLEKVNIQTDSEPEAITNAVLLEEATKEKIAERVKTEMEKLTAHL